jgi:hypothetical protein
MNEFIRAMLEHQRRIEQRKAFAEKAAAIRSSLTTGPAVFFPTILTSSIRRKVFISYHHADQGEVENFLDLWCEKEKVFIPYVLGLSEDEDDDIINSTDPDYVASQIRKKYIDDTSVTIVLIGKCTHSRRYVDWEIKASLTQGIESLPNGLLGVLLPSQGKEAHFPERFIKNWASQNTNCYAKCYVAPTNGEFLRSLIEDAYIARTQRAHLIDNPRERMIYNQVCKVCNITH